MNPRSAGIAAIVVLAGSLLTGTVAGTGRTAQTAGSSMFTAAADAYVRSNAPTANFGAAKALYVRTSKSTVRRAFLRFAVDLPPGATVSRATLQLYAKSKA